MIEPVFNNALRRAILDVTDGNRPASILTDPVALHQVAMTWNFDSSEPDDFLALAEHPDLARGTLLLMYWRSAPTYYCRYASGADVPDAEREGYALCEALAAVNLRRTDLREGIAYDPKDDDGTDWTTEYDDVPWLSAIPSGRLLEAVPGEGVAWPIGPDRLSRAPDAAERATIAAGVARGRGLLPGLAEDASPYAVAEAVCEALRRAGPAADEDLAWPWLDALGWTWQCGDSPTDGVLFGVAHENLSCLVPDIVSRTIEAGIDPAETLQMFGVLEPLARGPTPEGLWQEATAAFNNGWLV